MNEGANFDYEENDALYFNLIFELAEKNQLRYEKQTEQLLKQKRIHIQFSGADIEFKLTPMGCSFYTKNPQSQHNTSSWVRMGWGKSAKREALPQYFAKAEATVILDQQEY